MTRWIQLSSIPLALAAVWVLVAWAIAMLRKPRPVCRGPVSVWDWLPWRLLLIRSCGYDLTGLTDLGGEVQCPECGTRQKPTLRRRVRSRPRFLVAGGLLLAAGACWKVGWIRYGGWAPYLPSRVLVELDFLPMPRRVESVLLNRLESGRYPNSQHDRLITLALHHLGNDNRQWNARFGWDVLWRFSREASPRLERTLDDKDYQRRQSAAEMLRCRSEGKFYEVGPRELYEPSDRLLEVSIEALRNDQFEYPNAESAFAFLLEHKDRALPLVRASIKSEDHQQAFAGALLAGYMRAEDLAPLAAPVLVSHLRSNAIYGDARIAAPALLGLGEGGRTLLLPAINGDDEQARMLAWVIIKAMDHQMLSDKEQAALRQVTLEYKNLRRAFDAPDTLWAGLRE